LINGEFFNKAGGSPRILVAPLDWGLGHATRCIPIINELIKHNCEVIIAASGAPYSLLKKEFPTVVFLPLDGYKVRYSLNHKSLSLGLMLQLPRILLAVLKEHGWLKKIINDLRIDAVISDNRFGLFNKQVQCIYMTHQVQLRTGNSFSEIPGRAIHRYFINKYDHCWIPDTPQHNLAGELSAEAHLPPATSTYIGPLSRFKKSGVTKKLYDLLVTISGLEPQRTIFENILLAQLKGSKKKVLIIRGLPASDSAIRTGSANIEIVNHLSQEDMNVACEQAEIIISRSGYSTIMDLVKLERNALLVPTPGQAEQEYLAAYLMEKKYFFCVQQKDLVLESVLKEYASFNFTKPSCSFDEYKKTIAAFVLSLKTGNFATQ
jgi:uncharacterized protein (TIGR00661 family)